MITIQAGHALVIDDEPANRDFVERLLQTASFKVSGASTGTEGLRIARAIPELALALVDQQLPDATGLEIIAALRADNPEALLVMATMHDERALIDQAFAIGVDVFLVKPHGFMELYRRLQEVDSNIECLRSLIIDQYGPRPYRSLKKAEQKPSSTTGSTMSLVPLDRTQPVGAESELSVNGDSASASKNSDRAAINTTLPSSGQDKSSSTTSLKPKE